MSSDHSADDFFCVATVLPIRRWQDLWPFLMLTRQIKKQLRTSSGFVRYRIKAAFFQKRFWTLSIWRSKAAANEFVRTGAHSVAVQQFQDWAAPGAAFVEWYSPKKGVKWREAFERLETPTYSYDL